MKALKLPAVNIQHPWAELIIAGKKSIETRHYPLPKAYIGKEMLVIETPGKEGRFKRRAVGLVVFGESFQYESRVEFYKDRAKHLVDETSTYAWITGKKKWGWPITKVVPIKGTIPTNLRTGIVFTKTVRVALK
jgi:hypothetical protein